MKNYVYETGYEEPNVLGTEILYTNQETFSDLQEAIRNYKNSWALKSYLIRYQAVSRYDADKIETYDFNSKTWF